MPRQDPRLTDAAQGVPQEIRDRTISHALYLERLKTQEANKVIAQLNRAYEDVVSQLENRLRKIKDRGFDAGPKTTRRLQEMAAGFRSILDPAYQGALAEQQQSLQDIARSETQWQAGTINHTIGIPVEMALPSASVLREIVSRRPFQGRLLRDWYKDLSEAHRQRLAEAVRLGVAEGQTTDQIVRRIRGTRAAGYTDGVMEIGRRQAEAVTRTAISHVSSNARSEMFKANDRVVKSVQWVSTLDSRTTPICRARDGKVYPVDGGPRPPAHIGCRSSVSPVLRSWQEMGIDANELPPSSRASMNGQVPETTTYNEWLRSRVNAGDMSVVREALGAKRAKLFAAGGLDVQRFVDRRGRQLTLKQLQDKERSAFEAAGVQL